MSDASVFRRLAPGFCIRLLLLAGAISPSGCAHRPPPVDPAKLAEPSSAALTFARALDSGNIAAAKASSIGDRQQQWVEAMASMSGGLRAAAAAINRRFGGSGVSTSGALTRAAHTLTGEMLDGLDKADAQIDGNRARMVSKDSFATGRFKAASILRRDEKGAWRVDLPEVFKQYPVLEAEANSAILRRYRAAGKALHDIADDVRDGNYTSIAQVQKAIAEHVGE